MLLARLVLSPPSLSSAAQAHDSLAQQQHDCRAKQLLAHSQGSPWGSMLIAQHMSDQAYSTLSNVSLSRVAGE